MAWGFWNKLKNGFKKVFDYPVLKKMVLRKDLPGLKTKLLNL